MGKLVTKSSPVFDLTGVQCGDNQTTVMYRWDFSDATKARVFSLIIDPHKTGCPSPAEAKELGVVASCKQKMPTVQLPNGLKPIQEHHEEKVLKKNTSWAQIASRS